MASETQQNQTQKEATAEGQTIDLESSLSTEVTFKTYQSGAYDHEDLELSEERLLEMYRNMMLQRRFEERAAQMYQKQKIAGFLHLYIGQEAVSTGAAEALEIGLDSVITAYRDHGIALAMGMDPKVGMAELFGKKDGCSKGKGGSMHFFDKDLRMMGGHGIVGGHIPVGAGLAFGHKYKEDGGVNLCFFGDGAMGQGAFHEALNLASLYELPVVFIVENNSYAMGTAVDRAFGEPRLHRQAFSYDMPGAVVNGMDVFSVTKALREHVAMARENQPSFLEVQTYRYRGHSMSDPGQYRTKDELDEKKAEDPIIHLKSYLIEHEISDNDEIDQIDEEVKQEVLDAVDFAENSPFPDLESIYDDIYAANSDDHPYLILS